MRMMTLFVVCFQNPIGSVYHGGGEDGFAWENSADNSSSSNKEGGGDLQRQWSGSMLGPVDPGRYTTTYTTTRSSRL